MPRPPTERADAGPVSCSVLVVSCDRYRDLWEPFFTLFARYWPDCPFPVYLGSNFAAVRRANVAPLHAGEDASWSTGLRSFLEQIDSEYVLILLEDFFLDEAVDTAAVKQQLNTLHRLGGTTVRLFPNPPCDYALSNQENLGATHKMAPYRVSLQAALWNKAKLMALTRDGESSWEFEWKGTERSETTGGFYCVRRAVVHYQHVVERGAWFWTAARRYQRLQIGCDMSARAVMTPGQAARKKVVNVLRRVASRCRSKWLCIKNPEAVPNAF